MMQIPQPGRRHSESHLRFESAFAGAFFKLESLQGSAVLLASRIFWSVFVCNARGKQNKIRLLANRRSFRARSQSPGSRLTGRPERVGPRKGHESAMQPTS